MQFFWWSVATEPSGGIINTSEVAMATDQACSSAHHTLCIHHTHLLVMIRWISKVLDMLERCGYKTEVDVLIQPIFWRLSFLSYNSYHQKSTLTSCKAIARQFPSWIWLHYLDDFINKEWVRLFKRLRTNRRSLWYQIWRVEDNRIKRPRGLLLCGGVEILPWCYTNIIV